MPIIISIKVVPQAGRFGFQIDKSGVLKCYLVSPAEDGKANRELIKELSRMLKVPQGDITIMMGDLHRKKTIKIVCDYTLPQVYALLGVEHQEKLLL